jgi:hypothetical protein
MLQAGCKLFATNTGTSPTNSKLAKDFEQGVQGLPIIDIRALTLESGRDGALRRPRRVQRRNGSARCFAGGDIAARCPYQCQVHGRELEQY